MPFLPPNQRFQSTKGKSTEGLSGLFKSDKLTIPQVIATKSKCNNDRHQGSFHINSSNITGHHVRNASQF